MGLFDRLKVRKEHRRLASERDELTRRVKLDVWTLPSEVVSTEWIEWFWRQPPDAWERIIDERRQWSPPPTVTNALTPEKSFALFDKAMVRSDEIKASVEDAVSGIDDRPFFDKMAAIHQDLPPVSMLDSRLTHWLDELPYEAREGGAEICGLLMTMDLLRTALADAIRVKADEPTMERLHWWIRTCDKDYREVAEPFFEIYGRPILGEARRNSPP